jgi:hypothetical protein
LGVRRYSARLFNKQASGQIFKDEVNGISSFLDICFIGEKYWTDIEYDVNGFSSTSDIWFMAQSHHRQYKTTASRE